MTVPALSDFRPLSMGELMDRAVRFWRSHVKPLFQLYLAFNLAGYVLIKMFVSAMRLWFPLFENGLALASTMERDPALVMGQLTHAGAMGLPILCAYGCLLWLAAVAGSRYVVREYLGQSSSPGAAVRYALSRAGPATRSLILIILLVTIICFVAGIAAGVVVAVGTKLGPVGGFISIALGFTLGLFGFLLGFLWYLLRFLLIAPVLAVEELGAVASMKRSRQLVAGRIGPGFMNFVKVRATVVVTAMVLVLLVVTSLGSVPALMVTFGYSTPWNYDPAAVPELLLVPAELFQVAVQSLFGPLYISLASVFYVDMRVRREGLDLQLKLEDLPPRTAAA